MRRLSMELPGKNPKGGDNGKNKRGNPFHALFLG
jgi:hypothetical protein